MLYVRKLSTHGGTHYVALPGRVWRGAGLAVHDHVTVTLDMDGTIRIKRVQSPELNPPRLEQRP